MARPPAKKGGNGENGRNNAESEERTRLKQLALSRNLLSRSPAKPSGSLTPSKAILKHQGRDIVKKGQRKNRFLFSFPGLLAPTSGGKIGELIDLGTKNPILYLDFPQGRVKLFGTIVFPKNKYLTLQFGRGSKSVMCEDAFENMIVFSDAWWIGRKTENPDEAQLPFPEDLNVSKKAECDFKGGAGENIVGEADVAEIEKENINPISPESMKKDYDSDSDDFSARNVNNVTEITPVRHSARTAGRIFKYADDSSEDDTLSNNDDGEMPKWKKEKANSTISNTHLKIKTEGSNFVAFNTQVMEEKTSKTNTSLLKQREKSSTSVKIAGDNIVEKQGKLMQTTLSYLFGKGEQNHGDHEKKGSLKKKKTDG